MPLFLSPTPSTSETPCSHSPAAMVLAEEIEWEELLSPSDIQPIDTAGGDGHRAGDRAGPITSESARAVWRAVLTQALVDARSNMQNTEAKIEKARARSWLLNGGNDFNTVCELAGLNPEYVRRRVRNILEHRAELHTVTGRRRLRPANPTPRGKRRKNTASPPFADAPVSHSFATVN